jgi:hypothetical protein
VKRTRKLHIQNASVINPLLGGTGASSETLIALETCATGHSSGVYQGWPDPAISKFSDKRFLSQLKLLRSV